MFGQAEAELLEEGFLLCGGLGNAAQTDFVTFGGGQDDVGALQSGEQGDSPHMRERLLRLDPASEGFGMIDGRHFNRCFKMTHSA